MGRIDRNPPGVYHPHFAPRPMLNETIAHYRILGKLGSGGMGIVYEAEDTKLGRRVALKFLPEDTHLNPQFLQRFLNDAHTAATELTEDAIVGDGFVEHGSRSEMRMVDAPRISVNAFGKMEAGMRLGLEIRVRPTAFTVLADQKERLAHPTLRRARGRR